MEFGITSRHLRRVAIVGGVMGTALFAMFVVVALWHGKIHSPGDVTRAAMFGFGVGAIMPAAVVLCSALRLRIEGDQIEQTLFGKWVLDKRSISELAAISLHGRIFPVVLSFRGGGTMRLIGIHLGEEHILADYLQNRVPGCIIED